MSDSILDFALILVAIAVILVAHWWLENQLEDKTYDIASNWTDSIDYRTERVIYQMHRYKVKFRVIALVVAVLLFAGLIL